MATITPNQKKQNKQKAEEDSSPGEHQQKRAKMSSWTSKPTYRYPNITPEEYIEEIFEMRTMIEAGMMGWPGPKSKETLGFTPDTESWVIENAKSESEVNRLSKAQKQTIISSLAENCVQEEWDVLMGLLPDMVRENISEVFLEALIYKRIFDGFFKARFWYLDGKMDPSDEGDEKFGARLQHLYDRFFETNPVMASLWRSETNRLANSTDITEAPNTQLGIQHRDHRKSSIGQFVDETLSSEPIQWLLKEPSSKEQANRRYEHLYSICERAAENAVATGNTRGHIAFHGMAMLPETFTLGTYDKMCAHNYNFLPHGSTRLDGNRILMVLYPAIVRSFMTPRDKSIREPEYSTLAYVVVEDQSGIVVERTKVTLDFSS
ncbi:unnamed protein product [Penicillium glandicola]